MGFKTAGARLLRLLLPQRAMVGGLVALGALGVTLSVLGPKLLGDATDLIFAGVFGQALAGRFPPGTTAAQAVAILRAHGQGKIADLLQTVNVTPGQGIDFNALTRILSLVLVLYIAASVLLYLQGRLVTAVVQRTVYTLREQVADKLTQLPLGYFDRTSRGEIIGRVTNDIDNIAQTLQQTMSQLLTSLLTVIGVLAMMISISPLLAGIALITVPVSTYVAARIGKRAQPQFVAQWSTTGRLNGHIEEVYTAHALVRLFGRQREAQAEFDAGNDTLCEASFRAQFISGLIQPLTSFLGNVNYVLVAVVGALRIASGAMPIGDVQAFIQYSRQFSQPITQLASMANLFQSGVASAERVFELLDAPPETADPQPSAERRGRPEDPNPIRGRVVFDRVSFRYLPDEPLFDDLSLTVEPGHTVAIVGPTGAGKTTLVNLMMRFYEPSAGRITLDGVDIARMPRSAVRASIGMVLQDAWLFKGTIAQNIGYGAVAASREEIVRAAVATQVDHFVRTLPNGYDTVVDADGANLSTGQKQLITIARAFLARTPILILDEATSSVDTRTEVLVQRAMAALRQGRTSFIIAHRLSTIRDADLVVVMEAGHVVEQGTHDELLRSDSAFARLRAAQFSTAAR